MEKGRWTIVTESEFRHEKRGLESTRRQLPSLPAHRVGRLWKFKLSQVDAWIEAGGAAALNSEKVEP
jgi:hypothetical protein